MSLNALGQEVQILNYTTDINGQVQLEVESNENNYYILKVRHSPIDDFELTTSMTLGEVGTTIISESLESYPIDHYQVLEYNLSLPADTDGDGIDDVSENSNLPAQSPLNFASSIDFIDGSVAINNLTTYKELSVEGIDIPWAEFLNGKEFVKFLLIDTFTNNPKLYFINSETHERHHYFMNAVGIDWTVEDIIKGEVIFHPTVVASNGTLGVYSFAYSEGLGAPFETVQKTHELIAANMPFLKNNLSYFVTANAEADYEEDVELYDTSRVPILFEADVYAEIDFLAIHVAEGYGRLRVMDLEQTPGPRDIVLYESLPNNLPRVGGIITSFIQTPLSHVNLRAIQDNIPNAFIRNPLTIEAISSLVDRYIYYKVEQGNYIITETSAEEVNEWHESNRPTTEQSPPLNLNYTSILPLDEIRFDTSDGFGAKCANVATMRIFNFQENTIPNGYGVPFYFYQEFMKFNNFFEKVEIMIANLEFQNDVSIRMEMLKDFRKDIKEAEMPPWMLDELQTMQDLFPENISIRVRSSSNNEDLPGFSGAGLYNSKTQHPDEGHISKSVKQVYASLWNFRAYEERDYYKVNQYKTSMGLLCHANYNNEKANGVGVSTDPIYQTEDTFYLNTQVGEDLITNPNALSIPEEILLDRYPTTEDDYIVIRNSNQMEDEELVMNEVYLDQIREYLSKIHDEFAILYDAVGNDKFAMDIEYKVTNEDQLIIKQARPWATYWTELSPNSQSSETDNNEVLYFPNPADDYLTILCDCNVVRITIVNTLGQIVSQQNISFNDSSSRIDISKLAAGLYIINGIDVESNVCFSRKIIKR